MEGRQLGPGRAGPGTAQAGRARFPASGIPGRRRAEREGSRPWGLSATGGGNFQGRCPAGRVASFRVVAGSYPRE